MQTLLIIAGWIIAAITGGIAIVFYLKLKSLEYQNDALVKLNKDQQENLQGLQQQSSQDDNKWSKFIAWASHDLRQPLHALALFSDVLINQRLEPEVHDLAGKIKRSVNALVELFNTLFDVSKLETGSKAVNLRSIPLLPLLQVLDGEYKPQAEAKGLNWYCDLNNYVVHSDPALLETVLRNLISNALRYTQQGGIKLSCNKNNGQIDISVSDTGIGIPAQQQQEIFQEFLQLSNTSSGATTGLGLGLSIVERLIKLLGHKIRVQSQVGHGTTFTLGVKEGSVSTLPINQPKSSSVSDLTGLKVLVIDDEPQVREGMQSILESWQCEVALAGTKAQVYELLMERKLKPQAIVSDYRLAKNETGLQLLEELLPQIGIQVPVLFISGDTSSAITEIIRAKGYLHLPKPVPPAQLRAFLRNVVRKSVQVTSRTQAAGNYPLQQFSIQVLLSRFAHEYQSQAQEKKINFHQDCSALTITSNIELLESILRNLINFCFQRTTMGQIQLKCLQGTQNMQIVISYSGKPLSDQIQQLLRNYQNLPNEIEKSGIDLNLSLAFKIAGILGHQIHMDKDSKGGTIFSVLIPAG